MRRRIGDTPTSMGTLLCAVCAPFLGARATCADIRKSCLPFFLLVGVAGTALLAFTGNWKLMLAFYILSTLGFNGSCVFYDGFLNDVTTAERMDKVSTYGYGLGYIGGSTTRWS